MPQPVQQKENYLSVFRSLAANRSGDPAWLVTLREKAAGSFAALDFPTTRVEAWKYTNIAPALRPEYREAIPTDAQSVSAAAISRFVFDESRRSRLVFINGLFARELSDISALADRITVSNLSDATSNATREHLAAYADHRADIFTALNTASVSDGAFVHIPAGKVIEPPIQLLFVSTATDQPVMSHPRTLIVAERGAMARIIESYASLADDVYFTNAVTEISLRQGAAIEHYRLQEESLKSFHIGATQVFQERESNYASYALALGAQLSRHNLNVTLADEYTETTLNGLYVVTGNQLADAHLFLDHAKPHCTSQQHYKGILDDRARAVFNGRVLVRPGALLTDARQLNKNLLLSNDAHVDTKPELEIFADDVKCAHGATVGQLEDEEIFYLLSRGLKPETARALLTYGFAEDIISKIRIASVRKQLDAVVLDKLHQNLEVD
jgi:Fe-S cluster assembly protein SufD